jgi:predicted nuclease of predicted toxin-antitoxin system
VKFKLDENFGSRAARLLISEGHDAHTVLEERLSGAIDQTIFEVCIQEGRCLLTLDLDFTDVTRFPPHLGAGIAVLRIPQNPSIQMIEFLVKSMLRLLETESITGRLWIVEPSRIRIHERTSTE